MRELIEKNKKITVVPADFRNANKGNIVEVEPKYFTVEFEYEPKGILRRNYCEFYTQTSHGTLYFDSYAEEINGKTVKFASPAKHRFLQRRQYRRIKFVHDIGMSFDNKTYQITTLDISAGGMKCKTSANINIEGEYKLKLPLSSDLECTFAPIRIEKSENGEYVISGRFGYSNSKDKMTLTQYCAKRSIEIRNK